MHRYNASQKKESSSLHSTVVTAQKSYKFKIDFQNLVVYDFTLLTKFIATFIGNIYTTKKLTNKYSLSFWIC